MVPRTQKAIKRQRDNYLQWACILRECGDIQGYHKYLVHVEAMTHELNLRKYGSAIVF